MLCEAFAEGCGGQVVTDGKYRPGPAAFYGVEPPTIDAWNAVRAAGETFYYIDNGYMRATYQGGGYFRITKNAMQYRFPERAYGRGHVGDFAGMSDGARFRELGVEIQPIKRTGWKVVVAQQSAWWYQRHGTTIEEWTDQVVAELRRVTSREIWIRGKPIKGHKEPPLQEALKSIWMVVVHSSNVAVEAILAGVPAICLQECAASPLAWDSLEDVEVHPERRISTEIRRQWAEVLADNQWTVPEMKSGLAWEMLNA